MVEAARWPTFTAINNKNTNLTPPITIITTALQLGDDVMVVVMMAVVATVEVFGVEVLLPLPLTPTPKMGEN